MNDDSLKQLLQDADADAGPPPLPPPDLARRVQVMARRRRPVRLASGLAAAALLLAVGTSYLLWHPRPATPPEDVGPVAEVDEPPLDVAALRSEIARLDREADICLAVLSRTQDIQRQLKRANELKQRPRPPDAAAQARKEVEQAAFTLVLQADRLERKLNLQDSAVAKYQSVVELFPQTSWAAVARQRLAEINNQKGEV